ncbi:MAG: hypothetical protein BGO59_19675 [Spirosoma sp. 48-14]|nr:MAG: hypothetical protein BGO59_19675 [Spirosoma sp. 48-14]
MPTMTSQAISSAVITRSKCLFVNALILNEAAKIREKRVQNREDRKAARNLAYCVARMAASCPFHLFLSIFAV